MRALLRLKNYRCFSEEAPLEIPIGDGPLAIVGPNNSGKSAAIRLLHELQPLWNHLGGGDAGTYGGRPFALGQLRDVPDNLDVFHDRNNRDIEIELILLENAETPLSGVQVKRIKVVWDRGTQYASLEASLSDGSLLTSPKSTDVRQGRIVDSADRQIDATWLYELLHRLARAQYIPPHRNITLSGGAESFGISIGANFVSKWNAYKVGQQKTQTLAALDTEALVASIFGFDQLQINATPNNDLQVVVDGKPYRIGEVGHGVAQFIVTLVNLLFLKPPIVLLDEPETGLHPALQMKYLSHVAKASQGTVFFATHSIGLARALADNVLALRRVGKRSEARPFDAVRNYAEFVGELSFSTWREMGARGILLVEGVSDVRAIASLLRMLKKDMEIVVLPMGGRELIKAGTGREIAELRRLHTDVHVLIDSERAALNESLTPKRQQFVDECKHLGLNIHVLERRAIENYWPDSAIRRVKGRTATSLSHFTDIRGSNCGWGKSDNWQIASAATEVDLQGTDLIDFLRRI